MAITIKTLFTFVFTLLFIVSFVHCGTTVTAPEIVHGGMSDLCFSARKPCEKGNGVLKACDDFCTERHFVGGYCKGLGLCCCMQDESSLK
ncbi:hypothetical protein Bca4012_081443 [Brassica carinata]